MLKKLLCALLCVLMVLSLCACSRSPVIATYEGKSLTSAMYSLHLAIEKRAIEEYNYYASGVDISSTPAFWDEIYDEKNGLTWADYVESEFCNMLIAMQFCEKHGLTVTDESVSAEIDSLIESYIETAGSKDLLNLELAEYGADYDMLVEYLNCYQYINVMREYLADDGTLTVSDDEIVEYLSDYHNYDYIFFNALDESNQPIVYEDITTEQAEEYFLSNYVTVKHILYLTQDLTDEKKLEKKEKAEANLAAIQAGTAEFSDFEDDNEDSNIEYTFTYGTMVSQFEEAAYDMEVGELRVVETAYGYHLMLKEELDTDAFDNIESEVKAAMSSRRIKEQAQTLLDKIESGEAQFGESEDEEYEYYEGFVISKTDTTLPEDMIEQMGETAVGDYFLYTYGSYGYFIFKHVEFDEEDIEAYSETVSSILVDEKFTEYMTELSKSVVINTEEMSKFDIKTVRSFFSEETETE